MNTKSNKITKKNGAGSLKNGSNGKSTQSKSNSGLVFSSKDLIVGNNYSLPKPYNLNPESSEEHDKRLAKRRALTLRMLQKAYENHHRSKAS